MPVVLSAVYGTSAAVFMPAFTASSRRPCRPSASRRPTPLGVIQYRERRRPAARRRDHRNRRAGGAIALDAVTFALSAACLIALRPHPDGRTVEDDEDPFVARLRAGWREVRVRPWLRWGLAAMAAYHVFVLPAVFALGPALAEQELAARRAGRRSSRASASARWPT